MNFQDVLWNLMWFQQALVCRASKIFRYSEQKQTHWIRARIDGREAGLRGTSAFWIFIIIKLKSWNCIQWIHQPYVLSYPRWYCKPGARIAFGWVLQQMTKPFWSDRMVRWAFPTKKSELSSDPGYWSKYIYIISIVTFMLQNKSLT